MIKKLAIKYLILSIVLFMTSCNNQQKYSTPKVKNEIYSTVSEDLTEAADKKKK